MKQANPDIDEETLNEKLNARLSRNNECLESYINSLQAVDGSYDHVIINDLDQHRYYECIDNIINNYAEFDKQFSNPTAFVIMPMPDRHEGAHFYKVKEAIYEGAKQAGFTALRQDDKNYDQENIYSSIRKSIKDATVCIVDLTNTRPNCYFEAGLAFEKNDGDIPLVFLIAEQDTKIEFDLTGLTRKEYIYKSNDYTNITLIVFELLTKFKQDHIF